MFEFRVFAPTCMPFLCIHQALTTISRFSVSTQISKKERRSLTPWELPSLLTPVHVHRRAAKRLKKERAHFAAILGFVYRNRFAVASQIQRRFCNVLRSGRTTRRHLEELESLKFLGVAPGRGVGPLFPKVYYLTGRGVRRLKESLAKLGKPWQPSRIDRRGRDANEGYTAEQIVHELLITEFMLAVWQTIEGRLDLELLNVQRRSLAKHSAFQVVIGTRATQVIPDAMFLFRHNNESMCCCFLELDNGTMNAKQMKAKFARYAAWSQSSAGQRYLINLYIQYEAKDPRPAFRLLMVTRSRTGLGDDGRLSELLTAANRLPPDLRKRIWLTTVAALREHQHDGPPLDASIWLRAGDPHWPTESITMEKQTAGREHHSLFPPAAPM
jgi:Replication-relaxation